MDEDGNLIYKIEEDPAAIKTGVTANESGVTGTAESSAATIPPSGGDVKARAQAAALGLTLHLYTGDYMHVDGGECRGYIRDRVVFVRADDPRYTADQIMRHEAGHDAVAKGEIDPAEVLERLEQRYGEEGVTQILAAYMRDYEGFGMSADEIWDEIVCDSLGDMGVFAEDLSAVAPELDRVLRAVKDTTLEHARERKGRRTDMVK